MTASEMARKANENRRQKLGPVGYAEYMSKIAKKPRKRAKKLSTLHD